jgi:predicted nuclease of predicted toxin-antitoxin system
MKRILLDQGLPPSTVKELGEGWDAVHVRNVGMRDASDEEILEYGARESRAVITLDRDFPQILALTRAALPSVVLIRQQHLRAPDVAALLVNVWQLHEPEVDRGCVVRIGAKGSRIRRLPLA